MQFPLAATCSSRIPSCSETAFLLLLLPSHAMPLTLLLGRMAGLMPSLRQTPPVDQLHLKSSNRQPANTLMSTPSFASPSTRAATWLLLLLLEVFRIGF